MSSFAVSILRQQWRAMLRHEQGARGGEDIEDLHKMRVAVRRIRAALSLFRRELGPEWKARREDFAWVGDVLGPVRDLDVLQDRVRNLRNSLVEANANVFNKFVAALRRKQKSARLKMCGALDDQRYVEIRNRVNGLLRNPCLSNSGGLAEEEYPKRVAKRRRAFEKASERSERDRTPKLLHELRISAKKYRYALEFGSKFSQGASKKQIKALSKLQDELGAQQDLEVAKGLIDDIAADYPDLKKISKDLLKVLRKSAMEDLESSEKTLRELLS